MSRRRRSGGWQEAHFIQTGNTAEGDAREGREEAQFIQTGNTAEGDAREGREEVHSILTGNTAEEDAREGLEAGRFSQYEDEGGFDIKYLDV